MDKINSLKITQAVILAGGAGTRLRPFTLKNPKPLIKINGKPFLEHLINLLKENGIKEVLILNGYLGKKIEEYFKDGKKFGVKIKYSYTPFTDYFGQEIKSGKRILNAYEFLNEHFLLLYCDNYLPLNLKKLTNFYTKQKSPLAVTVFSNTDGSTKSNCFVSDDGFVELYDKERRNNDLNGVDIGFMIVDKKVLDLIPDANIKFEDAVFPKLIKKRKLAGLMTDQKYYSIGDIKRVKQTELFLKPKKIIFLDRDGVINKKAAKAEYITRWDDFIFLPGSLEAIKKLTELKYKIFIITNQAGIARQKMTEHDLKNIHIKMNKQIKKAGGRISGIYYCPHGWNDSCDCRKPKAGLFHQANTEHLIDLSKAIFIGDDKRDKEAGDAVNCKTFLINKKKNLLSIVEKITH